jgi:predicted RNA-binding Zn ribbon-like protein
MEALPLDPGDYTGTYKLVGGSTSLDLVNTISWPDTARAHDWLATASNVRRWCVAAGLDDAIGPTRDDRSPDGGRPDEAAVRDVHRVRRTLSDVLRPLAHGAVPTPGAVEAFNRALQPALGRRRIDPATLDWAWDRRRPLDALDPVILDAAHVLTSADRPRLRSCPACDWVFLDTTRNGRRRWCDMADCGSRAKSREYYHRHRGDDE